MIDAILELKSRCGFAEEIGKEYDLTSSDVVCMLKIANHSDITLTDLSGLMGLSTSRGSRIVSRLKNRRFIRVENDTVDRRSVRLSLSEAGRICYNDVLREKEACEARLRDHLTPEQEQLIRKGLSLLLEIM